jgi:large subunit ribosomal protein L25
MKSVSLNAFSRTHAGRGEVKKLRTAGRIPAIIYGKQQKPQNLEVTVKDMENLVHHSVSEIVLVDLAVKDDPRPKRLALVQDVQHHALSGKMVHIDFHEVAENEKVTIMVPVETTGEATGVKNGGGVLEHVLFKIKARALPKDLPEFIMVDVSHLEIGQAVHIGDIKAPEGVEILGDKHISVIAVAAPLAEVVETPAEGAAAGDVEMIKEKKEDGTEGAAPAKGAAPAAKAGDKAAPAAKAGEKPADKGAEKKAEKKK